MKLKVRVKPNSSKLEIEYYDKEKGELVVRLTAPPEKGKANEQLVKFLSKELGKKVEIINGLRSRDKVLVVR